MSDKVTSQELLFTDKACSTIDLAISSGCLFVDMLFASKWIIKMMWVFPKRRFDVVLHAFNPRTGQILQMHLTIFERMGEIISSYMIENAIINNYHFLCLLWSVIFPRGSFGLIVTEFLWPLLFFGFFLNWCKRTITTLIFSTNFVSKLPFMFVLFCANCSFISLKIFIVDFNGFCNFHNWFKWIIYF